MMSDGIWNYCIAMAILLCGTGCSRHQEHIAFQEARNLGPVSQHDARSVILAADEAGELDSLSETDTRPTPLNAGNARRNLGDAGPAEHEIESFLKRREHAIRQTTLIQAPMSGTSYTGFAERQYKNPLDDDKLISPPHEHVRLGLNTAGRWQTHHRPGLEFDVVLSEELISSTEINQIADQLNRHYAAGLVEKGWHLSGFSTGGNGPREPDRYWTNYIWTDLGRTKAGTQSDRLSYNFTFTSDDRRCGYFTAAIAVCVDISSRRAHVIITLEEKLGF